MSGQNIKLFFGGAIFLFSLALAYFTANYFDSNQLLNYWGTLALFAGLYVLLGITVSTFFPISLGFLFSAVMLILNILLEYYGKWDSAIKLGIVGFVLILLYVSALTNFSDHEQVQNIQTQ